MTRKIYVPGIALEVTCLIGESSPRSVISMEHAGEIVVVFFSPNEETTARAMSIEQGRKFARDVHEVQQAIRDDAAIKEMEREFNDE